MSEIFGATSLALNMEAFACIVAKLLNTGKLSSTHIAWMARRFYEKSRSATAAQIP